MVIPVEWLRQTFKSPSQNSDLLRPELENGNLTPHDYELASRFLPGPNKYWPYAHGFGLGASAALYGRVFRRPPWPPHRTYAVAGIMGFTGYMYGMIKGVQAHWVFTKSLDDPQGYMRALESVYTRTGGVGSLGFRIQNVSKEEGPADVVPVEVQEEGHLETPPQIEQQQRHHGSSASASPSQSGRWDQIRAASTRSTAQNSSWDALRQQQERSKLPENNGGINSINDRAAEQARFDAMVEAERRKG